MFTIFRVSQNIFSKLWGSNRPRSTQSNMNPLHFVLLHDLRGLSAPKIWEDTSKITKTEFFQKTRFLAVAV
jgi:hypothetical protein